MLVILTASLAAKRREVLAGIVRGANEFGWHVQPVEAVLTAAQFSELLRFWNPDGLIIECSNIKRDYKIPDGLPTVLIDRSPRPTPIPIPCVRNDSTFIAELVAREFLSLGLRHFAFVGWHEPVAWCEEKRQVYLKALALHGVGALEFTPTARDHKNQIVFQKHLRGWLRTLPLPCGLFAVNDTLAEQVLVAATAEGIPVPDELAVIGVDDDVTICERTCPTLTSVRPSFFKIGQKAVQLLVDRSRAPTLTVIRPVGLIRRGSSRLLQKSDPEVKSALELIRREACNGLTATGVLATFACSRRPAERRFQALTGLTVLKAIHRVRLQQAQTLLQTTDLPVKSVAGNCGWNSDIIFRRIFTSTFGVTPTAFRQTITHRQD